jgi:hypothetical protein
VRRPSSPFWLHSRGLNTAGASKAMEDVLFRSTWSNFGLMRFSYRAVPQGERTEQLACMHMAVILGHTTPYIKRCAQALPSLVLDSTPLHNHVHRSRCPRTRSFRQHRPSQVYVSLLHFFYDFHNFPAPVAFFGVHPSPCPITWPRRFCCTR